LIILFHWFLPGNDKKLIEVRVMVKVFFILFLVAKECNRVLPLTERDRSPVAAGDRGIAVEFVSVSGSGHAPRAAGLPHPVCPLALTML
jgi:hypothetical protein